jgi:hypothetical protein
LAWTEFTTTQATETFFQQYSSTGVAVDGVQHLQGWQNGSDDYPSVLTALSDGGFAISWGGFDGVAASEILIQRFDASGHLMPETLALTVDNNAPTLLGSNPVDEGTLATGDNITLRFSEDIALNSTGHVLLKDLTAGTQTDIDLTNPAGQLSVSDHRLIINPMTGLFAGHSYAVQLDAGAVIDKAGNLFAGITDDTTLNFVAVEPSVLHLGIVSGIDLNLVGGFTTSTGQRYYYLDRSNNGDGLDSYMDNYSHDELDALFNGGADTVDTQLGGAVAGVDDARTVVVGSYTLVLPTAAELTAALTEIPTGSNEWPAYGYMSATQTSAGVHEMVHPAGYSVSDVDTNSYLYAIQVVI